MGAKRVEYQIVGRYMNGKEVTAYHLQSIDTGKSGKYTRDQVCYLVGRDQITNCTGQIYQDKVILRGNGMSLDDLPVQYEDGDTRNMDRVGRVKRGTNSANAMEQFLIVGTIKSGRNTVGYVIQNAGCGIKKIKRQQVLELAAAGKIGNARVQTYQGRQILRGINCNLDELPSETIEAPAGTKLSSTTSATPERQPMTEPAQLEPAGATKSRKTKTCRFITPSEIKYDTKTGRIRLELVDFIVSNDSMNQEELSAELDKFKEDCRRELRHEFCNTDDVLDTTLKGHFALYTFDDAVYKRLGQYMLGAKRVGATFVVNQDVNIVSSEFGDLTEEQLKEAKKALASLIRTEKSAIDYGIIRL